MKMNKHITIDIDIHDFINQYDYQSKDEDNYTVCCPYCIERYGKVDYKYKLGISISKKVGHCFRCDVVLHFGQVRKTICNTSDEINQLREMVENIGKKKTIKEQQITNEIIDLDCISIVPTLKYTPSAYKYLKNRNITDNEIANLSIRVGVKGKWIGRVLFPFYKDNKPVFLIGRSYNEDSYRYLNSKGNKDKLLYKVGKQTKTCILCEGIFSAIAAHKYTGIHSIATLGKGVTHQQLKQIINEYSTVYYSFDGDVVGWAKMKVLRPLMESNLKIFNVRLPYGEDPDDVKEHYIDYFNNAERIF